MRKGIFTLIALLTFTLGSQALHAQCTPDPNLTAQGIYPNPMPDGCVGQAYFQVVDFVFPVDTTISGFTVPFDSFRIDMINNLPAGLIYTCNTPNCVYVAPGGGVGAKGCANVTGTPTAATPVNHMVDVVVTAWATLFGSLQSVVVTYQHPFEVNPSPGANFTVSTTGNTANFTNTSTGAGNAYTWDFGDGNTSTMVSPSHTYAMMGNYTVCLIANNGNCADTTCMNQAVGCPAPAVGWTSTSTNFTVDFTDQTPGNPQSWFWDLGDGNTSTMQNPTHVYAANGNYLVCLTVTDSCGTDSSCQMVTVNCAAPTAAFTFTSNLLDVDFTDASTSSDFIANWIWTFGDGNSSTMQNPSHTYAADGIYTVCLQVFDTCGIDSSCQTVNVTSIGVEAPALHSLNVFPNPTSGDFVLQGVAEFGLPVAIQVSDLLGKTIFTIEEKALNGPFEERISLAGATPGMYFVRINAGNQQQTLKLILE